MSVDEAQHVVNNARKPFPRRAGSEKHVVVGTTRGGRWIEVIYVIDDDGGTLFVIHARPVDAAERRDAQRRIEKGK